MARLRTGCAADADPLKMMIKNKKDFWAVIFFIAFGAGAAAVAQENALGTLTRMGPGFS